MRHGIFALKPAALSYKRHKEILKDYARRIMPYV